MEKVKTLNLLTVEEASKIASVSQSHLYHATLSRSIASVKLGGLVRFCKLDLGLEESDAMIEDSLLDPKELAEILKVHSSWIHKNENLLKSAQVKYGRRKRYSAVKLLKIINQSREERFNSKINLKESSWDKTKGRRIIFPGCPGYSKVS